MTKDKRKIGDLPSGTGQGTHRYQENIRPSLSTFGLHAATLLRRCLELLLRTGRHLCRRREAHNLHVCDVVSLGEKRFVGVVEYEGRRFLVGWGAASVSLLSVLGQESKPRQARQQPRKKISPEPPDAADETEPFNVKIAEAVGGARLAI